MNTSNIKREILEYTKNATRFKYLQKIRELFIKIIEQKHLINGIKTALFNLPEFNPEKLFNEISPLPKSYMTNDDIKNYLNRNSTESDDDLIKRLIYQYDKHNCFTLTYEDFYNMIKPFNCLKHQIEIKKNNTCNEIFCRLLIGEFELIKLINDITFDIRQNYNFISYEAYINITGDKPNLNEEILTHFLEHEYDSTDVRLLLYYMDKNNDGIISYDDFQEFFITLSKCFKDQKSDESYAKNDSIMNNIEINKINKDNNKNKNNNNNNNITKISSYIHNTGGTLSNDFLYTEEVNDRKKLLNNLDSIRDTSTNEYFPNSEDNFEKEKGKENNKYSKIKNNSFTNNNYEDISYTKENDTSYKAEMSIIKPNNNFRGYLLKEESTQENISQINNNSKINNKNQIPKGNFNSANCGMAKDKLDKNSIKNPTEERNVTKKDEVENQEENENENNNNKSNINQNMSKINNSSNKYSPNHPQKYQIEQIETVTNRDNSEINYKEEMKKTNEIMNDNNDENTMNFSGERNENGSESNIYSKKNACMNSQERDEYNNRNNTSNDEESNNNKYNNIDNENMFNEEKMDRNNNNTNYLENDNENDNENYYENYNENENENDNENYNIYNNMDRDEENNNQNMNINNNSNYNNLYISNNSNNFGMSNDGKSSNFFVESNNSVKMNSNDYYDNSSQIINIKANPKNNLKGNQLPLKVENDNIAQNEQKIKEVSTGSDINSNINNNNKDNSINNTNNKNNQNFEKDKSEKIPYNQLKIQNNTKIEIQKENYPLNNNCFININECKKKNIKYPKNLLIIQNNVNVEISHQKNNFDNNSIIDINECKNKNDNKLSEQNIIKKETNILCKKNEESSANKNVIIYENNNKQSNNSINSHPFNTNRSIFTCGNNNESDKVSVRTNKTNSIQINNETATLSPKNSNINENQIYRKEIDMEIEGEDSTKNYTHAKDNNNRNNSNSKNNSNGNCTNSSEKNTMKKINHNLNVNVEQNMSMDEESEMKYESKKNSIPVFSEESSFRNNNYNITFKPPITNQEGDYQEDEVARKVGDDSLKKNIITDKKKEDSKQRQNIDNEFTNNKANSNSKINNSNYEKVKNSKNEIISKELLTTKGENNSINIINNSNYFDNNHFETDVNNKILNDNKKLAFYNNSNINNNVNYDSFPSNETNTNPNINTTSTKVELNEDSINSFLDYIDNIIKLETQSLTLKENLSLREDMTFKELFCLFDYHQNNNISIHEFKNVCRKVLNLFPTSDQINLVYTRFDTNKDDKLNLKEFINMMCPIKKEYLGILFGDKKIHKVFQQQLSVKSKNIIINLLKSIILNETTYYEMREKLKTNNFPLNDVWIFLMNYSKDQKFLNKKEFNNFLTEYSHILTKYEIDIIFNKFDYDKDELINYADFSKEFTNQ